MDDKKVASDDKAVIQALAALKTDLAEAGATFNDGIDPSRREGVRNALVSIYRFLRATQIPNDSYAPIVTLLIALAGLDDGKVLPLVKPAKISGRPDITEGEWMGRALIAAGLELKFREEKLEGRDNALEVALTWIRKETEGWDVLPAGNSSADKKKIQNWRSEIKKRPLDDPIYVQYIFLTSPANRMSAKRALSSPAQWGITIRIPEKPNLDGN